MRFRRFEQQEAMVSCFFVPLPLIEKASPQPSSQQEEQDFKRGK
jgi:hypothetical protein